MSSLNEKLLQARERVAQLEQQKRLRDNREKKKQAELNTRRQIIIGKMVSDHFPEVLQLQPRRTTEENLIEFAPVAKILSILVNDKQYVEHLKEKAIAGE